MPSTNSSSCGEMGRQRTYFAVILSLTIALLFARVQATRSEGESVKFYLDSVNLEEVEQAYREFRVDGVTLSAGKLLGSGVTVSNVLRLLSEWIRTVFPQAGDYFDFPILAELPAELGENKSLVKAVLELREISPFLVVSLPCGPEGVDLAYRLRDETVPVNMRRVLTPLQAVWAGRCGAVSVSTCVGLREFYGEGLQVCVRKIADALRNYSFISEIVVPVTTCVGHVEDAVLAGADVVSCELAVYREALVNPLF